VVYHLILTIQETRCVGKSGEISPVKNISPPNLMYFYE
jgi:hypothetical protein